MYGAGSMFMYWFLHKPIVCTSDIDMVREICISTSFDLVKPSIVSEYYEPLLGRGILTSNGSIWKYHRKIIAPELYPDKVKVSHYPEICRFHLYRIISAQIRTSKLPNETL